MKPLFGPLRELLEKSTPGPWFAVEANDDTQYDRAEWNEEQSLYTVSPDKSKIGWETDCGHSGYCISKENAETIAEAHNQLPAVLAALDLAIETLGSISRNSCCEQCQEAKKVALSGLARIRELGEK